MIRNWFVAPGLALAIGIAVPPSPNLFAAPPQPLAFGQQDGWEVPPQEYNEVQRRGFHDGIEGARRDRGNGRRPDVNNREEYRNRDQLPRDIPFRLRDAYRDAFRRGYEMAASHLWGAPQPPQYQPPQPREYEHPQPPPYQQPQSSEWENWGMRGLRSDAQRQGYREGIAEARKDFQWHRRADPDDHEEYQHPYVAPELVDEYREGFMRGYSIAMSQLSGEPSWQQYSGDPGQWQPPDRYSEVERRGFHEGIEGARRDFGNHRRPDPANRDEYRNPPFPEPLRHEYREGFRRGYEMAAARLWGGQ